MSVVLGKSWRRTADLDLSSVGSCSELGEPRVPSDNVQEPVSVLNVGNVVHVRCGQLRVVCLSCGACYMTDRRGNLGTRV
jgi:hypothetical protein